MNSKRCIIIHVLCLDYDNYNPTGLTTEKKATAELDIKIVVLVVLKV